MEYISAMYLQKCTTPSDINQHLPTLRRLASECSTVVECGVRSVVSTWALLYGLCESKAEQKHMWSVDIVPVDFKLPILLAQKQGIELSFVEHNSATVDCGPVDLLFIDTLHVYGHLKRELAHHHARVHKYIVLHDTTLFGERGETLDDMSTMVGYSVYDLTRGLMPALCEFLYDHPEWKISEKYIHNNGLTVLKRISQ